MNDRVLVYGVGVAGTATVRALLKRDIDVLVIDDLVTPAKKQMMNDMGIDLVECPNMSQLQSLISSSSFVAPAPGVPEAHRVIVESCRQGKAIKTELDIAYEWESSRQGGPRPMLAVTGTDGKTTTVMMAESILRASGRSTVACGNTEVPLIEALDMDVDSFVVEATSFRLAFTESFRAEASAWLNLAQDHLDWHTSYQTYEAAKARMWRNVLVTDTAIGFNGDATVMQHLQGVRCHRIEVGLNVGDYRNESGILMGPMGSIMNVQQLRRSLPHDISNALVASALVLESGLVEVSAVARGLESFRAPHHRIEFVAQCSGVRWFDDSKATTPHAVLTAIRGFSSVVLIAGGRNKDLDLSSMANEPQRMKAVIAIGEASDAVATAFAGCCPVKYATSMADAVTLANSVATTGDAVLLSPGCTSYDWYGGYAQRGEDFVKYVKAVIETNTTGALS